MTSITTLPFAHSPASLGAAAPAARRAPAIRRPAFKLPFHPAAVIREVLTVAAWGGLIWFQYEIVRGFW